MKPLHEQAARAALAAFGNITRAANDLAGFQADLSAGGEPMIGPLDRAYSELRVAMSSLERARKAAAQSRAEAKLPPVTGTRGEPRIWQALERSSNVIGGDR